MRLVSILALAVLLASALHAQTAEDLYLLGRRAPAVGARMMAMGGASVAGLGDWTAAYANPAGLAYLRSAQATASGHAFAQDNNVFGGFESDTEGLTLGTAGYAAALPVVRGSLAFGGGYRETAVYAQRVVPGPFGGPTASMAGWKGEVALDGAAALTPRLMGGLSISAPIGQYTIENVDGVIEDRPSGPLDQEMRDATLAGVRARGGLSAVLGHGVRLGLTVETPTYLRIEESGVEAVGGEGSAVTPFERTVEMVTPWRVAAGFLAGGPGVLVSADVEVVDWSQARFDANGDPDLIRENAFAEVAYRTVLNSRVGAEAYFGALALRVGAAFQPDPRFDGPTPDRIRQTYAAGLGVRVTEQARLDVAFIHTRDADRPFIGRLDFIDAETVRNALQLGLDMRF
ncbi:MAG: hypothetical protein HKN04_04930 [Rhodothermaceae bacterium]|nr:hypothetical protein [Rhodothermaceae bacterium]